MSTSTGDVFKTIGPATGDITWKLFRTTDEIGRIYNSSGTFNVKAMYSGSSLYLRNPNNDGIRLRANATVSMTYGSWSLVRDGYGAIGPNGTLANDKAWSRWHLNHGYESDNQEGWRPHMRNGTLATGNKDLAYFGQMYDMGSSGTGSEVDNNSNALIGWGSNGITASTNSWDNCTFRFYTNPNDTYANSAKSVRGLEIMRLRPYRSSSTADIEGFVGIGDWAAGGDLPTERLDLLTGNVRIRALPGTNQTSDTKVVVVDANGVLHWRPNTNLNCEWNMVAGTGSGANDLYTAVGTAVDNCPDDTEAVGIGVDLSSTTPTAKLIVATDDFDTGAHVTNSRVTTNSTGFAVTASGGSTHTKGIDVASTQTTGNTMNTGVFVTANGSSTSSTNYNRGVVAIGNGTGTTFSNIGVWGNTVGGTNYAVAGLFQAQDEAITAVGAWGESTGGTTEAIGVRGDVYADNAGANIGVEGRALTTPGNNVYIGVRGEAPSQGISWGVYSEGKQFSSTASTWSVPSDEMLKINIEDLTGALDRIQLLHPKEYEYNIAQYGFMGLPSEHQYGLLAQDVQAVFPEFVADVRRPADFDSLGNEINPMVEFKAMQYGGLIPVLIAAVKEQNTTITTLQQQVTDAQSQAATIAVMLEQLNTMQEQLAACCAAGGGMMDQDNQQRMNDGTIMGNARALSIQPNPFSEPPTVQYTLERAGRMQLIANSADGKHLSVLREAVQETGEYQLVWDTNALQPGMYYLTLLLDGEPVVKKAVKVGR